MRATEVISSEPITVEQSIRPEEVRALTSCRAGRIVPVYAAPLLREDRVSRGQIRLRLEMAETVHPLMNAVNVRAMVHFIPWSAFDRFPGMDAFNRSYQGVGEPHNGTPIPFFNTVNFDRAAPFWRTLGIHWKQGHPINSAYLEAYNLLVNWRRKARSAKLAPRTLSDTTLAEAFWRNPNMAHIVPDFEQAMLDGEVPLALSGKLPVTGIGWSALPAVTGTTFRQSDGTTVTGRRIVRFEEAGWRENPQRPGFPDIFAEMAAANVKLSLSNIELAKQTVAFAKLREQYSGLDDDHLIDLLMEGIRVPEEALNQPILLASGSTIFGYEERHAMDGANLDQSVTTGLASLDLTFRTPPMNTGGIILVTTEIVPEQLFERIRDQFLGVTNPNTLPNFLRDYLDPEKVEVVQNQYVDVEHATPTGTFGYAPLNHAWKRSLTRIGGKYYRPNPDTFVENRQRFWSVERLNPALTTDFYLVNANLPHTVFADTVADPFEVLALGSMEIVGNTVFGQMLKENNDDYEAVAAVVDNTRLTGVPGN